MKINITSDNKWSFIFYGIILVLALIQAGNTDILNDEAYYWMYSKHLAWGYFDHPPVIAVLIKLGYSVFKNELGVRLVPILLHLTTIYLLQTLIAPKNLKLFYSIVASIAILHLAGAMALPDTPLLFFTVLFYIQYKHFLNNTNILNTLLLALIIGALLLSKYHGVLVLFFTILANLKLIQNKYFWLCTLISCLLLSPHIYWQIDNTYPTLKYHLVERNSTNYNPLNSIIYLIGLPFIYGPIIGFFLFGALYNFKWCNILEKTMNYNAIGIYLFFLIMSLKGPIEGHWTLISVIPMVYILYNYACRIKKVE